MDDNSIFELEQNTTSESDLKKLIELAEKARDLTQNKEDLESALKEINAELQEINEKSIPDMMSELGLSEFKLSDGTKLTVKDFVRGSLPKDNLRRQEALDWLESNGASEIVKTDVSMKFGKGEDNFAKNAIALLIENGYDPKSEKGVHPQTLFSFARERLSNGEDLPVDALGLYVGRQAKFDLKGKK